MPLRFPRSLAPAALAICLLAGAARADSCAQHFGFAGLPLVTGLTYSTYQDFPALGTAAALKRAASVLKREGYDNVRTGSGKVTATQETSGSGRPQTLTVRATKAGKGTRAEITFRVQPGQVSGERVVRKELCRLLGKIGG
jgi:hypothetical protein